MSKFSIYHNPRCSKSRQTLELLRNHDIEPEIVLYLDKPPSKAALKKLVTMLQITPRELLRKGEAIYKELNLQDASLSDTALIAAMHENPVLIERPIVIHGDSAVIGRPPENVLALL
jgi:arsenate reductase